MTQKQPVLAVFDIDGTLAIVGDPPGDMFENGYLMSLQADRNMVEIVKHYMRMTNVEILFCTGRPKRAFQPTWRWLNKILGISNSGRRVSLACRPDFEPDEKIATCKLHEITQAIRRVGSRPAEVFIYDDDLTNLRLFESLRPMVRHLNLFHVQNGTAFSWRL